MLNRNNEIMTYNNIMIIWYHIKLSYDTIWYHIKSSYDTCYVNVMIRMFQIKGCYGTRIALGYKVVIYD